jgi:proteic killer suppression protein
LTVFVISDIRPTRLCAYDQRDFLHKRRPTTRQKITDLLLAIDEAEPAQDIGPFPGWRLHQLKGDLQGFWSVTVSDNWRIIFRFEKGDAFDVDLVDYH